MKSWIKALQKTPGEWEICRIRQNYQSLKLVNGEPAALERSDRSGHALRLVVDDGQAFAFTRDGKPDRKLLEELEEIARGGARRPLKFTAPPLTEAQNDRSTGSALIDPAELLEPARQAAEHLLKIPGVSVDVNISSDEEELSICNSAGRNSSRFRQSLGFSITADLTEPGNMLTLPRGRELTVADHHLPLQLAEELAEEVSQARQVASFNAGQHEVLFSPRALGDILVALESGLNGQAIALGRSPLAGRCGEAILNEKLTLIEDPTLPGGNRGGIFDDEGIPCLIRPLVENGIMRNTLHNLQSATLAGTESTGNGHRLQMVFGRRDLRSRPGISRSHWRIDPGAETSQQLLGNIRDGLYADILVGSFMGDLTTGNFQATLWLGWHVIRGRIAGRVKNAMVTGNIYRILGEQLLALSQERGDPRENSGLQLPSALCRDVTVAC